MFFKCLSNVVYGGLRERFDACSVSTYNETQVAVKKAKVKLHVPLRAMN